MFSDSINWDEDLKPTPEEEYQALLRSLRRRRGFGLVFVQCAPDGGKALMHKLEQDLSDKHLGLIELDQPVSDGKFYQVVDDYLAQQQQQNFFPNIVFINGIEYSLYDYEAQKRSVSGWNSKDIYSYSLRGVPPILTNLNQQRERFRDNFDVCFVFLIPIFVFKYLIHRAPDFFDWRSGIFNFPTQAETVEQEVRTVLDWPTQSYGSLVAEGAMEQLLKIQNLIEENHLLPGRKAELYTKAGLIYNTLGQPEYALAWFEQALNIQPSAEAFWGRGDAFSQIERHQEALTSYAAALEHQPDYPEALYGRGNSLSAMGAYQEAIADYTHALALRPNYQDAIVKVVSLQALVSPQTRLKQQLSDRFFRRLRTATRERDDICRAVALRITQELLHPVVQDRAQDRAQDRSSTRSVPKPAVVSVPRLGTTALSQKPAGDDQNLLLLKGRERTNHCLKYYRMGSRKGRVELHSILAALAFPHLITPPQMVQSKMVRPKMARPNSADQPAPNSLPRSAKTKTVQPSQKQLDDIEDFLQDFYVDALNVFYKVHQLPTSYRPKTLLELAEYMAFTERYSQQRAGTKSSEQPLIASLAQQFTS